MQFKIEKYTYVRGSFLCFTMGCTIKIILRNPPCSRHQYMITIEHLRDAQSF